MPELMLEKTTPAGYQYKPNKTLDVTFNSLLTCDCSMSMEHLLRVQDPLFWDNDKLTAILSDDLCRPGQCIPSNLTYIDRSQWI